MKIGNIDNYGVYDSKKIRLHSDYSPKRQTNCFEFDYIISCDKDSKSFIGDKQCLLSPNLLIIRKPNEITYSKLHFKCYCLHLRIDIKSPVYNDLLNLPTYIQLINENGYKKLFESLFKHIVKNEKNINDYFTAAKLLELFHYLIKDSEHSKNAKKQPREKENLSVQKAILYIKQNYDKPITLADLSKEVGYTPNHFQRIFSTIAGISPQKYLEEVRINNAKDLLSKNELSIADVAYNCGFSSQSYFSKTFKKNTLITPNEFKNSIINKLSNK